MSHRGKIIALSVSKEKGIPKTNVDSVWITENYGIEGDAHAGDWHRQISLLAIESINKLKEKLPNIKPGAFAENITTQSMGLTSLSIGEKLKIGENVKLEITQIGKECHSRCAIYYTAGDCVMPKEGIFARVLEGGRIYVNDDIVVVYD